MELIGAVLLVLIVIAVWMQIPPESEETKEARKRHGKVE